MTKLKNKGSFLFLICIFLVPVFFLLLTIVVHTGLYSGAKFSEEKGKIKIYLENTRFFVDSCDSVYTEGNRLIIKEGGVYQLSGIMEDGQIIVDAGKDQEVTLKLDSVDITCKESAPLVVKSADQVVIKLKKGSENYFRDGLEYKEISEGEYMPKACIDSRDDLKIKGPFGSLTVEGNYKHGIRSTDDLKIKSGTISVTSVATALKGKDSVRISGGDLQLNAGEDGIYSGGLVRLEKGHVEMKASRYGIFGKEELKFSPYCQIIIEGALSPVAGEDFTVLPDSIKIIDDREKTEK